MSVKTRKCCPKCGGVGFFVTAHVCQDWEVDEEGEYVKVMNECSQVTHFPDDEDIWECVNCGYSDAGKEFNRAEETAS